MNQNDYTEEQKKDINERVEKAVQSLKELNLRVACVSNMVNTGDDVFAIKLIPYLQDTLYTSMPSPIQP